MAKQPRPGQPPVVDLFEEIKKLPRPTDKVSVPILPGATREEVPTVVKPVLPPGASITKDRLGREQLTLPGVEYAPTEDEELMEEQRQEQAELEFMAGEIAKDEEDKEYILSADEDAELDLSIEDALSKSQGVSYNDKSDKAIEALNKDMGKYGIRFVNIGGNVRATATKTGKSIDVDLQQVFTNIFDRKGYFGLAPIGSKEATQAERDEAKKLKDFIKNNATAPMIGASKYEDDKILDESAKDYGTRGQDVQGFVDGFENRNKEKAFLESIEERNLTAAEQTRLLKKAGYQNVVGDGRDVSRILGELTKEQERSYPAYQDLKDNVLNKADAEKQKLIDEKKALIAKKAKVLTADMNLLKDDFRSRYGMEFSEETLKNMVFNSQAELDEVNKYINRANALAVQGNDIKKLYDDSNTYLNSKHDKGFKQEYVSAYQGMVNTFKNGWNRAKAGKIILAAKIDELNGGITPEDRESYSRRIAELMNKPELPVTATQYDMYKAMQSGNAGAFLSTISNPLNFISAATTLASESFAQMIYLTGAEGGILTASGALIGGLVGGITSRSLAGARAGAAAGLRTAGTINATVGNVATNLAMETALGMYGALQEKYTAEDVLNGKWLDDPEVMDKAFRHGMTRGSTIGLTELIGYGVMSRFRVSSIASTPKRLAQTIAMGSGVEIAQEMTGEALAQVVSGEDLNAIEIIAEGLGAVGMVGANPFGFAKEVYEQVRTDYYTDLADNMAVSRSFINNTKDNVEDVARWAKNMKQSGKISEDTERKIIDNISDIRQARAAIGAMEDTDAQRQKIMEKGTNSKAENRLADLFAAKRKLERVPDLNKPLQQAIKDEISEISLSKKVPSKGVDISSVVGTGPTYKYRGQYVTGRQLQTLIVNTPDYALDSLEIEIEGDEKMSQLLRGKAEERIDFEYDDMGDQVTFVADTKEQIPVRFRKDAQLNEETGMYEATVDKTELRKPKKDVSASDYAAFQAGNVSEAVLDDIADDITEGRKLTDKKAEIYKANKEGVLKRAGDMFSMATVDSGKRLDAAKTKLSRGGVAYAKDKRTGKVYHVVNLADLDRAYRSGMRILTEKPVRKVEGKLKPKKYDKKRVAPVGEQARDRGGRRAGGTIAPLEGAPVVQGATGPDPGIVAVAEKYAQENGIDLKRQAVYVEVDPIFAKLLAAAFENMKHDPSNPKVRAAYDELIKQTKAQYQALVDAGYEFTFYDGDTDPYDGKPWRAVRDLRDNKRMAVYGTYAGYGTEGITDVELENNPMLRETGLVWKDQNGVDRPVTANDLFRAVHDAFGHSMEGAGFRARGEENAWQAHVRLYTGDAVKAMTTETRGQNSWLNFGLYGEKNQKADVFDTVFAENKIGLLPEWAWTENIAPSEESYQQQPMDTRMKYSLLEAPEDSSVPGMKYLKSTLDFLSAKFDTPYVIVYEENSRYTGYIDNTDPSKPKIVVNAANADYDTPMHLYSYIFLNFIKSSNKNLYSTLIKEVEATEEGKREIKYASDNFKDLTPEQHIDVAISELLGKYAANEFDPKTGIHKAMTRVWNSIIEFIEKAFNVKISDITPNASIEELARLLSHANVRFDAQSARLGDMEGYIKAAVRDRDEAQEEINEFLKIKDPALKYINTSYYYVNEMEYQAFRSEIKTHVTTVSDYINSGKYIQQIKEEIAPLIDTHEKRKDFDFALYPEFTRLLMFISPDRSSALRQVDLSVKGYGPNLQDLVSRETYDSLHMDFEYLFKRALTSETFLNYTLGYDDTIKPPPYVQANSIMTPEEYLNKLQASLRAAQDLIDDPSKIRRSESREFSFIVETDQGSDEYTVRGYYYSPSKELSVSFKSARHNMDDVNSGLFFKILPKVIGAVAAMFPDVEYDAITFTPVSGDSKHGRGLRLKGYNIFARRLFGKYSLLSENENETTIPVPPMFRNQLALRSNIFQLERLRQFQQAERQEAVRKWKSAQEISAFKDLATRVAGRIGATVKFVNDPKEEYRGYYDPRMHQAVINLAYATSETVFHEILGHPIILAMKSNPEYAQLYENLKNEVLNSPLGQEVLANVREKYNFNNEDDVMEEAIVQLLGMRTDEAFSEKANLKLLSQIKKWLKEMAAWVRDTLRKQGITIEDFPIDATIEDIGKLLGYSNQNIILPGFVQEFKTPTGLVTENYADVQAEMALLAGGIKVERASKVDEITALETKMATIISSDNNYPNNPKYIKAKKELEKIVDELLTDGKVEVINPFNGMTITTIESRDGKYYIGDVEASASDVYKMVDGSKRIAEYIKHNKEFARNKSIILNWKEANGIVYNPEEAYSRGHVFTSEIGLYSNDFDTIALLQNLMDLLDDVDNAGGEVVLSTGLRAAYEPDDADNLMNIRQPLQIIMYPAPDDILWASDGDVMSGTIAESYRINPSLDAVDESFAKAVSGTSLTKYPGDNYLDYIQPNIADCILSKSKTYYSGNEQAVRINGNNWRIQYRPDAPSEIKKLADTINGKLDEKYGPISAPKIARRIPYQVGDVVDIEGQKFEILDSMHAPPSRDIFRSLGSRISDSETVLGSRRFLLKPLSVTESGIESLRARFVLQNRNYFNRDDFSLSINELELPIKLDTAPVQSADTAEDYRPADDRVFSDRFENTMKQYNTIISEAKIASDISALRSILKKYPRTMVMATSKMVNRFSQDIREKFQKPTEGTEYGEGPMFSIDGKTKFFHASDQKRRGRLKKSTAPQFGSAVYFSTSKKRVMDEFGDNVTEVELDLKNPLYTNTREFDKVGFLAIKLADDDYGRRKNLKLEEDDTYFYYDFTDISELAEIPGQFISQAAEQMGYDAIVDKGSNDYENEIAVLNEAAIIYEEDTPKFQTTGAFNITEAIDENGEPNYEAYDEVRKIAKERNLGITSDRELSYVARDSKGNVIGGAFTSYDGDVYTFDVVVSEQYEGKGLGSKLLDKVVDVPYYIKEENPNVKIEVDVVNAKMQEMLSKRGFAISETIGKDRVIMTRDTRIKYSKIGVPSPGAGNTMLEDFREARDLGFPDDAIERMLLSDGYEKDDVEALMELGLPNVITGIKEGETIKLPASFANAAGGAFAGTALYNRVRDGAIESYINRKKDRVKGQAPIGDRIVDHLVATLKADETFKASPKDVQQAMLVDIVKSSDVRLTKNKRAWFNREKIKQKGIEQGKRIDNKLKGKLISYIIINLPKAFYTKKDVKELLQKVKAATTTNIMAIQEEVLDFVTKTNVGIVKEKINALLKKDTTKQKSGREVGAISMTAQEYMDGIEELMLKEGVASELQIESSIQRINEQLSALLSEYESAPYSQREAMENRMAILYTALMYNSSLLIEDTNDGKLEALEEVLAAMKEVLAEGKADFIAEIKAATEKYNNMKAAFFEDITGGMEIDYAASEKEKQEVMYQLEDIKQGRENVNWLQRIGNLFMSAVKGTEDLDALLDRIALLPSEFFDNGIAKSIISGKIFDSRREQARLKKMTTEMIRDAAKKIFGENYKKVMANNAKSTITVTARNGRSVIMSLNEAYYYYNMYKDPANHPSFQTTFGDDYHSTMYQIIERLSETPKILDWADWQVDVMYPILYDEYNAVYRRIYRTDMPWNRFYAGRIYRDGVDMKSPIDIFSPTSPGSQEYFGGTSTKSRKENKNAIKQVDGDYVLFNYLEDMNFFASFGESLRDINKILSDKYIAKAIEAKHSKKDLNKLREMIKRIYSQGLGDSNISEFFGSGMKNFITAKLAFNPKIMLQQLGTFIGYVPFIGYTNWGIYAGKVFFDKIRGINTWKEMVSNSQYLTDRFSDIDIREVLSGVSAGRSKKLGVLPDGTWDKILSMGMIFMRTGDKMGIMGAMPNYLYYKESFMKQGRTEEDAIKLAVQRIEKQTQKVAQSNFEEDKDLHQTGNAFYRAFSIFASQPKQYFRQEVNALRNMYRILANTPGAKGTFRQNLRAFITYHFVAPLMFQWIVSGFPKWASEWDDDDTEDMIWAAILGNINAIFIIGDLFVGVKDVITGKPWAGKIDSLPVLMQIGDVLDTFSSMYNAKKEETRWKNAAKLASQMAEFTGLPAGIFYRYVINYIEFTKNKDNFGESILRLLGYSDYVVKGANKQKKSSSAKLKAPRLGGDSLKPDKL